MKKILIALLLLSGCAPLNRAIDLEVVHSECEPFQQKLLDLHNQERKAKGYLELKIDKKLCEYAQKHANYMADKENLVHSSMSNLMKVNNDAELVGENIAWGQKTEESVVSSWMWSPMHRWNILGSGYKRIGFGMRDNYWCVVFSD